MQSYLPLSQSIPGRRNGSNRVEIMKKEKARFRPWKPYEAIGKPIRFKAFDHAFLITHASDTVFEFSGYTYSPREVLLYCEQINGKPCGEEEDGW